MNEHTTIAPAGLDELGLATPFAEGLDAGEQPEAGPLEAEWGETPFSAGENPEAESFGYGATEEAYAPEGEQLSADVATLEAMLEAEAGPGTGVADRVKGVAEFVLGPTLRVGSSGAGVATLQRCLAALGLGVSVDGRFGPGTVRALRAFQSRSGIGADGVAGPRTKAAIAAALGTAPAPPPAPSPSPAPAPPLPGQAGAGRLVVDQHPLIRGHRGTAPDLILRWNGIGGSGAIDVVVHFHGYSGQKQGMRIDRDKEPRSGLDFTDPAAPGTPGRQRPTLGVLPRGNYFGGNSGDGYNFPNLTGPGAVQRLVQDALARVSAQTGYALSLDRLILTGHSGGGAPVTAILAHTDPDEVHIFDGTYGDSTNISRWAARRIARDLANPATLPPAMRVLYRPGTGTQPRAEAIARNLRQPLSTAAAARLRPLFRVDQTPVVHNDIPGFFGWRLLADPAADLPRAKTFTAGAGSNETAYEEPQASRFWESPPTDREESQREAIGMSEHQFSEPGLGESYDGAREYRDDREELAWLDVEAPGMEAEMFDQPAGEAEGFAGLEPEGYDVGEAPYTNEGEALSGDMATLEALLEAETGAGISLADRVKGVAEFVLGPTLKRGSSGGGVATLQRSLAVLGADIAVDGDFGPNTDRAVRAFQSRSGLAADGIAGPGTKAAIAAALGRGGPAPAPLPPPVSSTLCDAIARVAEQEFQRWHPSSGDIHETDNAAVPILQQYYREGVKQNISAAQLQDTAWQNAHPWSSVFISFVMRTAGAGSTFAYSAAHQGYIRAARKNRLDGNTSSPFWAYRATEVVPQIGDIICRARNNSGATYDNIADPQNRATHGDVVTEVHPGRLRVIGGNVRQNVDAKTNIRTLPDGRLAVDGNQADYFAVVRCRGALGGQQPAPTPPTPTPPAPGPSGAKLTPAQFVATYGASARASEAANGVPALVTLGQAALESGWGAHAPRFNFFGIKAKASDPEATRQLLRTREVFADRNHKFPEIISITPRPDGKFDYIVRDWFRAYPDAATAFNAHGEFLVRNKRYAKAFTVGGDPYAFAAEVARAGYATDPSYERVLAGVMRTLEKAGGP